VRESVIEMAGLRRLYELIGALNHERSLDETLARVVDGVVAGLGFGVAAVNVVHADGTFETVAVAGSDDARVTLLGSRAPADAFDVEFAVAEHWGTLRFVPHERLPSGVVTGWVPPADAVPALSDPAGAVAWHPMDALFAPLQAPSGQLVGMLSVDLPADGRRPGPMQRELLEMFAVQAGTAIDNARLTEQLHASEEGFRLAFEGAGTGMSMISLDPTDPGRFLRVNAQLCRITGYPADELLRLGVRDITHGEDQALDMAALAESLSGGLDLYQRDKRYLRKDGSEVWVSVTTSVIRTGAGRVLYGISQVEDITARKAGEAALVHLAAHDPLTGLPNRSTLSDRLEAAVERAGHTGATGAVLFCDLDGFKAVNDTHGHAVGDQVLEVVAARLAEQVRPGDLVARLGGDEFVVVAESVTEQDAAQLATRLQDAVAEPIAVDSVVVRLTVSVGTAALTGADSASDVLRRSDVAMFAAKASRRASSARHA